MFSCMKLIRANIVVRVAAHRTGLIAISLAFLMMILMGTHEAGAGYQPDLQVRLASEGDAAYLGAGLFETSALAQSKSQAVYPGTSASFRVMLKNGGDLPDSFLVRGTGSDGGFTVRFLDESGVDRVAVLAESGFATRVLSPGESLAFSLQVTPVLYPLGASFRVTVGAVSASDSARVDQVKTETVPCGSSAQVTVSSPPDGSGPPGSVLYYPYTVTNVGSAANSFALSVASPAGWPSALYADDGAGGGVAGDSLRQSGESTPVTSTGALAPGAAFRFFVAVTIPQASADGARADTRLAVSGEGASGADQVTTSAIAAVLSLVENVRNLTQGGAFAAESGALPGDTLEYRLAVTNSGSAPASLVSIGNTLPASSSLLPGSLWIGSSPAGEGSACAASLCGSARESGGGIVAHLGAGATEAAGGSLAQGNTLYLFFRARVE